MNRETLLHGYGQTSLKRTQILDAPQWIFEGDDKKKARRDCIQLLSPQIPLVSYRGSQSNFPSACTIRTISATRSRSKYMFPKSTRRRPGSVFCCAEPAFCPSAGLS